MSGDPAEMEAAAVLDHHEHIKGGAGDGVDVREVNREDRVGLGGEELCQVGPDLLGAGSIPRRQESSTVEGGDTVGESDQLAMDAAIAPP